MTSYFNSTSQANKQRMAVSPGFFNLFSRAMAVALVLATATTAAWAAGNLDRTFGTNGKAVTPIGSATDRGYAMALQPDGKIVVAGASTDANGSFDTALARYNTDGTLDQTFGTGGKVIVNLSITGEVANAVALQSDGKIVIAGSAIVANDVNFIVTRFNSNGTVDTSFGTNGSAITPVGAAGVSDTANAIEIQTINSEERIVVVGSTGSDFAVVRYNPDGTLDATFDADGIVITSIRSSVDTANGVAIQRSTNKIVVAGMSRSDLGGGTFNDDFALVRYNSDGSLDVTFDTDGKVTTNISVVDAARDVVIQEIDGLSKIVAGGISMRPWPYHDFTLVRYNDNGAVDTTFGTNGRALTAIGIYEDQIHALALQPDNKIVAAGFARTGTNGVNSDFALARYNADGSLDTSFASCGKIITATAAANGTDLAYGVAVQPDGKVVVAGHTQQAASVNDDLAVLRYMPNGSAASPTSIDFDGDGRTDVAVYRAGNWHVNSSCASQKNVAFGTAGDRLVPADYDGDGKTDFAVFRSGVWYISRSSNNTISAQQFGLADDIPVTGDYDGDNKADIAVFRPSNGYWYVSNSSNGALQAVELGTEGDLPVPADYNGDGTTEFAVFRPSNSTWYTSPDPSTNYGAQQFGQAGDVPVQGDYDGDAKADIAVFRPSTGTWYLQQSTAGLRAAQFGLSTDQAVAGDYDGDGKHDLAVFRSGVWYIANSTGGTRTVQWGVADDLPVAAR